MVILALAHDAVRLPEFLPLEHLGHGRIEADGIDAHHLDATIEDVVHRFLGHAGMIGEIRLVEPLFGRIGAQQHDIAFLDPVAAQLLLGFLDVGDRDLVARPLVRQVEHHAIAVAVLNRNPFGSRCCGIDVPPRIDVRPDVVASDDHAVVGNLGNPELVGPHALRHLAVGFHLDDDRLGDVRVGHHPLEYFHAEINQSGHI